MFVAGLDAVLAGVGFVSHGQHQSVRVLHLVFGDDVVLVAAQRFSILEPVRWNYRQIELLKKTEDSNYSPFHFGIGLAANAHLQLHLLALANSRIVQSLQDLGNSQFSQSCKSIRLKINEKKWKWGRKINLHLTVTAALFVSSPSALVNLTE